MTTIYAKHLPYENGHLAEVVNEMRLRGCPTLRVVKFNDKLYAIEGSHRLAACHYLGIVPKVVIQIPDALGLPDEEWERIAKTLPEYTFEYILKLDLSEFNECSG